MEIPKAGYTNPMKMTKTTNKSSSKMDFYQVSNAGTSAIASTYSYKANSAKPMPVSDKDANNFLNDKY